MRAFFNRWFVPSFASRNGLYEERSNQATGEEAAFSLSRTRWQAADESSLTNQ
jgi:hypothetical protein